MARLLAAALAAAVVLALGAQPPKVGTLPPGPAGGPVEVIHTLLLQAQMFEDGRVLFCFPRGDRPPDLLARVDGKDVRAVGTDLKALTGADLRKRLVGWTPVVQSEFELPDPFFLKALSERTVVFALPKDQFSLMAKASARRRAPGEISP